MIEEVQHELDELVEVVMLQYLEAEAIEHQTQEVEVEVERLQLLVDLYELADQVEVEL